ESTDTLFVNVTPVYSVPVIDAGSDISIEQGTQVTLSAIIVSAEYELESSWFTWISNGLVIGTGKQITTNNFVDVGTFTITLAVALPDLNTITDSLQITVLNRIPICSFESPAYLQKGQSTGELVAIVSDIEADNSTLIYSWNFGDGTANITTKSASHIYTSSGTYAITLVVTDRFGGSSQCTRTIVVNNSAPEVEKISFVKESRLGEKVTFALEGLYDSDGEIRKITWDFGDGSEKVYGGIELANITHTYKEPGEYTVTVVIEDDEGKITTITDKVSVKTDTTMPWVLFIALIGLVFVIGLIASRKKPKEEIHDMQEKKETAGVVHSSLENTFVKPAEPLQPQSQPKVVEQEVTSTQKPQVTTQSQQPLPISRVTVEQEGITPQTIQTQATGQISPQTSQSELQTQSSISSQEAKEPVGDVTDITEEEETDGSMLSALLPPGASMPEPDKEDKKE
ncbi:MAG: PKD domain-containing protein, partial [Thermoplasmata archaeon]